MAKADVSVKDNATPASSAAASQSSSANEPPSPTLLAQFKPLWPSVLGLAGARIGLTITCYNRYERTDDGFFTDGTMLVALFVFAIVLFVMGVRNLRVHKRMGNRIVRTCILVETMCIAGITVMRTLGANDDAVRALICILCSISASWAMFYWLRRARGIPTTTAAVFVFSALVLSEVVLYLCTLMPSSAAGALGTVLVSTQFACMIWARREVQPHDIDAPHAQASDFFGFAKTMMQSKRFLATTAIGIGLLSIVIGFLRGFPDGAAIPFQPATRLAYLLVTLAVSAVVVGMVLHGRQRVMTTGIFIVLQIMASLALLLYAALPDRLDVGAVFTTTLNAIMVAFVWYVILAFMGSGRRDPYYYAMGGWVVWLGCRGTARILLLFFYPISAANDALMQAIMGMLIVISAQVVYLQFLRIEQQGAEAPVAAAAAPIAVTTVAPVAAEATPASSDGQEAEKPLLTAEPAAEPEQPRESVLMKVMGLDDADSAADVRQRAVQHSAEQIGEQFMLSEREVQVLSLYALGWTQKRVAEELYISPGTAHAHIKRIYAKTGLHSRQEILDYMEQYTS